MIEKIIYIFLIIIFLLIIFSYKRCEKFYLPINKNKKYIPQYIGPIIFKDYNDNKIGTYPDDTIWDSFFEKENGKYINLIGAGKPVEIKFPKSEGGIKGPKGYKGLRGNRGPIGNKGINTTGRIGEQGPNGERGNRGPVGSCNLCLDGAKGADGIQGPTGNRGGVGPMGRRKQKSEAERGPRGDNGVMGSIGLIGPKGPIGDKGPPGEIGPGGDVLAAQGARGLLHRNVSHQYIQINREENLNSYDNIKIGNNNTIIKIKLPSNPIINKTRGEVCIKKNSAESCINKNDIKNLYEFNNPVSTCPNGKKQDKSTFNGIECKSCNNGFYLKVQEVNGKWKKNIKTNICEKCKTCGDNKYIEGCGGKNPGTCKTCGSCSNGYRNGCGGTSPGTCVPCGSRSCGAGYHSTSYSCKGGAVCKPNQCVCLGNRDRRSSVGKASYGTECPKDGDEHCQSCYTSGLYSLTGNNCYKNEIKIYQNSSFGGDSTTLSGPPGSYVKLKDIGWKDKISSFKKNLGAKVTIHGRDNDWPNSGGDWASLYRWSSVSNIGSSWNDETDVISFGDIPSKWRPPNKEDPL